MEEEDERQENQRAVRVPAIKIRPRQFTGEDGGENRMGNACDWTMKVRRRKGAAQDVRGQPARCTLNGRTIRRVILDSGSTHSLFDR